MLRYPIELRQSGFYAVKHMSRKHGRGACTLGFHLTLCERQKLTWPFTETVDDLMKLACALTKRRATSKSKNGTPFECAITNGQTRW